MGSSTENSAYARRATPGTSRACPGGSSGGSAAAVAAGMAPLALGTDTGGSIRQPAALCGVVGLKPTYGRVSRYGLVAFASSLDQVGPLARTVADAALAACDACSATTRATPPARPVPVARLHASGLGTARRGLRIGVPWSVPRRRASTTRCMAAFREALDVLRGRGRANVVDIELPHMPHAIATYYIVATAEAPRNLARFDGVRYGLRAPGTRRLCSRCTAQTRDRGFGAEVKRRIMLGTFVLSSGYYDAYYLRAQKVRTLIRRDFEAGLRQACDVVATPTTPTPAFRFGEKTDDPLQMYLADIFTVPANLAGIPGLSVPCGFVGGLPVGLQFLGRPLDEATLFRTAAAFEAATEHHKAQPPSK